MSPDRYTLSCVEFLGCPLFKINWTEIPSSSPFFILFLLGEILFYNPPENVIWKSIMFLYSNFQEYLFPKALKPECIHLFGLSEYFGGTDCVLWRVSEEFGIVKYCGLYGVASAEIE